MQKSIRKIKNSTFCKIVTHHFNLILGTRDYDVDITHQATFGSNRSNGSFPPNTGNITLLWLFCCPVFFLGHAPRSNRYTDSYAEWLKRRVSAQGRSFWGVTTIGDVIWRKYASKTPQKGAWIGSFKPKRQNLYITISPELLIRRISHLRTEFRPRKALCGWSAITPKANTTWLTAAILKIDMTSYYRTGWSHFDEIRQPDAE